MRRASFLKRMLGVAMLAASAELFELPEPVLAEPVETVCPRCGGSGKVLSPTSGYLPCHLCTTSYSQWRPIRVATKPYWHHDLDDMMGGPSPEIDW